MITFHLASDVLHAASVDTSSTEDANSWRRQNYFEFHELRAHRVKPHAVDNWVTQGRVQPQFDVLHHHLLEFKMTQSLMTSALS